MDPGGRPKPAAGRHAVRRGRLVTVPGIRRRLHGPNFTIAQPGNTFIEKWNGRVWREVTKPTPFFGQVSAVAFGSAKSAFAVGSNLSLGYNPNGWTLIERWNGTAWG